MLFPLNDLTNKGLGIPATVICPSPVLSDDGTVGLERPVTYTVNVPVIRLIIAPVGEPHGLAVHPPERTLHFSVTQSDPIFRQVGVDV